MGACFAPMHPEREKVHFRVHQFARESRKMHPEREKVQFRVHPDKRENRKMHPESEELRSGCNNRGKDISDEEKQIFGCGSHSMHAV